MPSTPPKPGVGLQLRELIERYLAASGGYGKPAALGAFGLSPAEAERTFSALDEDYLISRYLRFRNEPSRAADDPSGQILVNGFPQTHVVIDAAIQSIL